MRSELVTAALKYVSNRYQLTHLAAKAIRKFHRPNTRIADTTNEVLFRFGLIDPRAHKLLLPETKASPRQEAVQLRRAS